MFLLRAAFWLSVVILLIPADPQSGAEAPRVTVIEALVAARATIADMSAFCERNPDVCVTGSAAFSMFRDKAESGIRMLYRYLDGDSAGAQDSTPAGGTLLPEDKIAPWRDPKSDRAA